MDLNEKRKQQIESLLSEGRKLREIPSILGLSRSTIWRCFNEDKFKDDCPKCDGKKRISSKICSRCYYQTIVDRRVWDEEKVVAAIQKFYEVHGKTPSALQWEYKHHNDYPTTGTVLNVFGKWNKAIEAAGYKTRDPRNPDYRKLEGELHDK